MSMPPAALAIITGLPDDAVEHEAEVQLARHLQTFFDEHATDDAPLGSGLMGDERHADHRLGKRLGIRRATSPA